MKKTVLISALAALSTAMAAVIPLQAQEPDVNIGAQAAAHSQDTAYNWYCKHTKDHSQPPVDSLLSFSLEHGAYYADRANSEWDCDGKKVIYLTFDAGYENGNVEKILDTLKEKEVPGAFFVLENLVRTNPELIRRMNEEGHLICNHTATHKDMTTVDREIFEKELSDLKNAVEEIDGCTVAPYYRPPEGRFSQQNLDWACELGYKTVFWSFGYVDWDNNAQPSEESSIKKVIDGTHNGEVVLLHPTSKTNAAILGRLIDQWRDMGFEFGTLDRLCK